MIDSDFVCYRSYCIFCLVIYLFNLLEFIKYIFNIVGYLLALINYTRLIFLVDFISEICYIIYIVRVATYTWSFMGYNWKCLTIGHLTIILNITDKQWIAILCVIYHIVYFVVTYFSLVEFKYIYIYIFSVVGYLLALNILDFSCRFYYWTLVI